MSAVPELSEYANRYGCAVLERRDGILELTLHTDGGSLVWNQDVHDELPYLFNDIANDRENKVLIITGTGDAFCDKFIGSSFRVSTSEQWDVIWHEGCRLLNTLLDVRVPVIAAVNGPARYHAEIAIMSDIVIASETAIFQDAPHFPHGGVPGDGVHVVWTHVLGPNRGRYFLLTGQELDAETAFTYGVVNEVHPAAEVLPRAREIAEVMAAKPVLTLRYTRELLLRDYKRLMRDGIGLGLALQGLATQAVSPLH